MARSAPEIPNEIVWQIFAVFATTLSTDEPALFPWFLGHICSTWRCIFLSMTTEFWHNISIVGCSEKYERTIDVVRFFLERDPAAPFSFHMGSSYDPSNPQRQDCVHQTREMLIDESMRWRTASIHLHAQHMLPLIRIKNRLPLLQELHFSSVSLPELYDVFLNAPSLDVVKIGNLGDWRFGLLNLKAIDMSRLGSGAYNFFATLPQMTKLERLEFGCLDDWWFSNHVMPSSTSVLPNLTKLSCGEPRWLRFMKVPSLEDLSIDCHQFDFCDVVLSFLSRSSCNLNISSLGISRTGAATVIEIVRNTPRITHLQLMNISPIDDVFKQLTIPTNPVQEALALHVQSLCFRGRFSFHNQILYDLISSRTESTTDHCHRKRLQKLKINISFSVPEVIKDISVLCEERGVEFEHVS